MHRDEPLAGLVRLTRAAVGSLPLLLMGLCSCLLSARGGIATSEGLKGASRLIEQIVEKVNPRSC